MIFSFMMRVPRWFQMHWATMTTRAVNNIADASSNLYKNIYVQGGL